MKEKQVLPFENIEYRIIVLISIKIKLARGYLLSPLRPAFPLESSLEKIPKIRFLSLEARAFERNGIRRVREFLSL